MALGLGHPGCAEYRDPGLRSITPTAYEPATCATSKLARRASLHGNRQQHRSSAASAPLREIFVSCRTDDWPSAERFIGPPSRARKEGSRRDAEFAEKSRGGSSAPKGHNKSAQGNALGGETEYDLEALKGATGVVTPFQGYGFFRGQLPRALPWADLLLPLRGDGNRATSQHARPRPTCPLRFRDPRWRFGFLPSLALWAGVAATASSIVPLRSLRLCVKSSSVVGRMIGLRANDLSGGQAVPRKRRLTQRRREERSRVFRPEGA